MSKQATQPATENKLTMSLTAGKLSVKRAAKTQPPAPAATGDSLDRRAALADAAKAAAVVKPPKAAKAPKAPRVTVTAQLVALFDQVGVEALPLRMAQDLAEAHGFNRTSAGITFCRWRAARAAGLDAVPASSPSAAKASAEASKPKH